MKAKPSFAHLRIIGFTSEGKYLDKNIEYFKNDDITVFYRHDDRQWDWSLNTSAEKITAAQTLKSQLNNMDAKHEDTKENPV